MDVSVSVIIPMCNAERYLAACLDSLVSQDFPPSDYEVILVDNGSTDRSVEIARGYDRVTLLAEPVPGAYSARNRGIRAARGNVLAFTDPDCVPSRSWVRAVSTAMADASVQLACGRRLSSRPSVLLRSIVDYENTKDSFVLGGDDEELCYGYTSNMAARRQLFDDLGLFLDRPRGADTLFVRMVAKACSCAAIRYLPDAVVTHLELDSVSVYFKKVFLYGHHRQRNNSILRTRALTFAERIAIFRQTVRAGDYSGTRAAALLGVLAVGSCVWVLGSASARLEQTL